MLGNWLQVYFHKKEEMTFNKNCKNRNNLKNRQRRGNLYKRES